MAAEWHRPRSLGQICRSMNTGCRGHEAARRNMGRELGAGEQGAGRARGGEGGCSASPATYTFWWSLTRFRRTLIWKRNAGGW